MLISQLMEPNGRQRARGESIREVLCFLGREKELDAGLANSAEGFYFDIYIMYMWILVVKSQNSQRRESL